MTMKIELSESQAQVIQDALDFYIRCRAGQLDEITSSLFPEKRNDEVVQGLISRLHVELTGLQPNAYLSVPGLPEEFKIAYDLKQVIRYHLSFSRNPGGDFGVNFDSNFRMSSEFPAKIHLGLSEGAEQLLKIIRERIRWKKEKEFDANEFVTPKGSKFVKELLEAGYLKKGESSFTLTAPTKL